MMKKMILVTLAAGAAIAVASTAEARDGCGPGFHRTYYGRCEPNGPPPPPPPPYGRPYGPPPMMVGPGGLVIGMFYPGRGYWDGNRYWHHREHWHGGWRYR